MTIRERPSISFAAGPAYRFPTCVMPVASKARSASRMNTCSAPFQAISQSALRTTVGGGGVWDIGTP